MDYIRIWSEKDIREIIDHIILVDDKFGFCPGCREIGLKIEELSSCPKCAREFRYVSSKDARGSKGAAMVRRIMKKMPGMAFVDYDDYEQVTGRDKAKDLFRGI